VTSDPFTVCFATAVRAASAHAANMAILLRLQRDLRRDFEQELLLELWCKRLMFDRRRGCWRTFTESVIGNKMRSLVRHMHAKRFCQLRDVPLEEGREIPVWSDIDRRVAVSQVLTRIPPADRVVACSLAYRSVPETARRLGISRSTVYRVIRRLRTVFTEAGLGGHRRAL
jgi:RNA polymerase sigma factor (sigma-70 family)